MNKELIMPDITKILVIEPKSQISEHLKENLDKKQTIVFMVNNISEAIERLKFVYFDILIADIQPDWNNQKDYHILRSIRWMSPQIKILLLIPQEKAKQINYFEGLEISDVISKPWESRDLFSSINHLIKKSSIYFSKN